MSPVCQPILLLASGGDASTTAPKIHRRASEVWSTPYTAAGLTSVYRPMSLTTSPPDLRRVLTITPGASGAPRSADAGATWTTDGAARRTPGVDPSNWDVYTQDQDGAVTTDLYKSTNYGVTYSLLYDDLTPYGSSVWVSEGWVWFISRDFGANTLMLRRIRSNGTGVATIETFAGFASVGSISMLLRGTPGINTFYLYNYDDFDESGDGHRRIDVSGDSYTVTPWTRPSFGYPDWGPGDPNHGLIADIAPVSATRALLHVTPDYDGTGLAGSAIWATDDGGATWAAVLSNADLDGSGASYSLAVRSEQPNHIAAAGALPYYWESADAGATWTKRSVDVVTVGADGVWTTIGWANTCAVVVAQNRSFAAFVG